MLAANRLKTWREEDAAKPVWRSNTNVSRDRLVFRTRDGLCGKKRRFDRLCQDLQSFSRWRQLITTIAFQEQARIKEFLQRPDVPCDSRMFGVKRLRCSRKRSGPNNGKKVTQIVPVRIRFSVIHTGAE